MPIKQIKEIHNIKNFINFSCESKFLYTKNNKQNLSNERIVDLQKNEKNKMFEEKTTEHPADVIIYAPNGTGKTSLSRVLNCWDYKNKIFNPDEINKIKSIEVDDELKEMPKIEFFDNSIENKILVFNHDFMDENVLKNFSQNKKSEGYLTVAKESKCVELEKKLEKVKKFYEFHNILKRKKDEKLKIELEKRKIYIKKECSFKVDGDFIFENLNANFIATKQNFDTENDYFAELKQLKSINVENTINNDIFDNISINLDLLEKTLHNDKSFPNNQKEIEEYILKISRDWIETGLTKLSLVEGKCPFCQANIDNDLMKKYEEFFKKSEKILFLKNIDILIKEIENCDKLINNNRIKYQVKFSEISKYIDLFKLDKINENDEFNIKHYEKWENFSKDLLKKLKEKENNISNKIDFDKKILEEFIKYFNRINTSLNDKIKDINTKISSNKKQVESTRDNLLLKELILFYKTNEKDLNNEIFDTKNIKKYILNLKEKIEKNKQKLEFFRKLISQTNATHYEIDDEWKIRIKGKEVANTYKSFSDGEKTIFGFLYFIASIIDHIEMYDEINNLTLVIDDPISSLDEDNFYLISNLIKDIGDNLKLLCNNEKKQKANPQLIISTHNLTFYNLLVNNIYNERSATYLTFLLTPNGLQEYKKEITSDYFEILSRINSALQKNEKILGSDLRYILECLKDFLHYKNIKDLIKSDYFKIKELNYRDIIVNDLAHGNWQKQKNLDQSEIKKIAQMIVNKIKEKFPNQL